MRSVPPRGSGWVVGKALTLDNQSHYKFVETKACREGGHRPLDLNATQSAHPLLRGGTDFTSKLTRYKGLLGLTLIIQSL